MNCIGLATQRCLRFTGHAVSVPGTVAGWSDLLNRHGRMSLGRRATACHLDRGEWLSCQRDHCHGLENPGQEALRARGLASGDLDNGPVQPSGNELLIDGRAPHPGEIMRIPTLGATLRGIAAEGKDYIYRGEFAEKLSAHVQRYGGWITPEDMATHTSDWDEPITADYRGVHPI